MIKEKKTVFVFFLFLFQVVATVHQPSSRLLDHFDHLYIVADGSCIYQGPPESLVSYLKITANLSCPSYNNPADFGNVFQVCGFTSLINFKTLLFSILVLDVASGEYGDVVPQLTSRIENGRVIYGDPSAPTLSLPSPDEQGNSLKLFICYLFIVKRIHKPLPRPKKIDNENEGENEFDDQKMDNRKDRLTYATSFHTQVSILLERTWRTIWREKVRTESIFTWLHFSILLNIFLRYRC